MSDQKKRDVGYDVEVEEEEVVVVREQVVVEEEEEVLLATSVDENGNGGMHGRGRRRKASEEQEGEEEEEEEEEEPLEDAVVEEGPVEAEADEDVMDTLRWAMETDTPHHRTSLPVPRVHNAKDQSMWSVLRKNAGKRMSHISMPVTFNEPLSALQRLCEEAEHSHLLDQASIEDSPHQRLLLVGAFAVSMYGQTAYRSGRKPFNPILGETFDAVLPDRGFRFIAEQVSHHPPISVGVAESKHWTLYQEAGAKTSMRPSSLKIVPHGFVRVKLHAHDETYEWSKVTTTVEDVLSGKKWVDHHGKLVVTCLNSGDVCLVEFQQYSVMSKKKKFNVRGQVLTAAAPKRPVASFSGKWTEQIVCDQTGEVLWTNEPPSQAALDHGFGFSAFACRLNELPPQDSQQYARLLPSDSRFRPDQRMLENAQYDEAAEEKKRVEQVQRDARAARAAANTGYEPRFFRCCRLPVPRPHTVAFALKDKRHQETVREEWVYKGGYWRMKAAGSYPSLPPLW
ncbi:oxysterol-binding protein 1 [Salpingoeca rosetta]|uniref:Oxysterol-binding protein 1 n=1 Tax=Salpingoeca rosetta (strain ATCC 50818 / BSB-021) TaxID=946362 RepID=F2UHH1_SALR5|nr:oxysterol-binding protein 1 [Salpingoeca rosetta]EGD76570.1 oxysterol-binding protein 1 [Salpingoeca rosetta]|eukprot:XP_004991484.1 oxysterol-binding protein 1 [Salpingoeca rosetta]